MDDAITHWINAASGSNAIFDDLMMTVTRFGVPFIVLAVAAQWWARMDRYHVRHVAVSAGLSLLLGLAINQVILLFVHRMRPYDTGITHLLIDPSADWSFPSDHATAAFAVVGAFAAQRLPGRTFGLLLLSLLVCWSRIYIGTHYLTDVLGGVLTGLAGALFVRWMYREHSGLDRFVTKLF